MDDDFEETDWKTCVISRQIYVYVANAWDSDGTYNVFYCVLNVGVSAECATLHLGVP